MTRTRTLMSLGLVAVSLAAGCEASDLDAETALASTTSAVVAPGQLDTSFNGTGRLLPESVVSRVTAIADAGGGKVEFFGTDEHFDNAAIMRLAADGSPDPTWSWNPLAPGGDRVIVELENSAAGDLLVQQVTDSHGIEHPMTYAVGTFYGSNKYHGFLIELDDHGQRVHGFNGGNLMQILPSGYHDVKLYQIELDSMGRLVVGGLGWKGGPPIGEDEGTQYAIAMRFDPTTGALDTGFGTNGVASHIIPTGSGFEISGMAIGKGHNDVVLAYSGMSQVIHFTATGTYDSGFGTPTVPGVGGVAVTASGRIFAASNNAQIYALRADGDFEESFGQYGRLDASYNDFESLTEIAYSEALDRLFVLGNRSADGQGHDVGVVAVIRPDGMFDQTFDAGSYKVVTNFPESSKDMGHAIGLQGSKILGGFVVKRGSNYYVGLARYQMGTGGVGEPCASSHCDSGEVCKTEKNHSLSYKICRVPTPTPPPPPHRGDEGEDCLTAQPWCNDEAHDTCDLANLTCRPRHLGDECRYGSCPDGEVCVFLGFGAFQCQLPSSGGCEYQVRARTKSCTNVSNPGFTADGFGPSESEAKNYARMSLGQQVCEGTASGCCEFAYTTVGNVCE
jgi:hypothetical protein